MDSGAGANSSSDFVRKLYKMLEDQNYSSIVRWSDTMDSFVVLENEKFTKAILPKHFKHSNFASFVRQLNKYDFHKVRHSNEEGGQSPYGVGAWEFKHPDFKANNKDALDNIRRKAPVPRKPNQPLEEVVPTQQMDLVNGQLVATQQQLQSLQERYQELMGHQAMLLQEVIGLQKTVVNHEHVIQNVMSFLHSVDAQRRRDSRIGNVNPFATQEQNVAAEQPTVEEEDEPASPLQHASKLLHDLNADNIINMKNLEQMNRMSMRVNGTLSTPPPSEAALRNGRPSSRNGPTSASSATSLRFGDLENMVYPVGQNQGIDPMYSEHVHNIPYPMPSRPPEPTDPRFQTQQAQPEARKKHPLDPGWIKPPSILLVEDDPTCRRIGGKFLYAFNCSIDSALDGLEAVNKMNAGSKYDLILMDIIMPNLDGVSATHLIRQFDSTPIVAMTSNIRSDDISMYFQHGMNDVLPKPFTKEGLLSMLEKHLSHLRKGTGYEHMAPGPMTHTSSRQSLKEEEDSPGKSEALSASWNSPNQIPGVSPVASTLSEDYAHNLRAQHHNAYAMDNMQQGMSYANSNQTPIMAPQQQGAHRRHISDISGGEVHGPQGAVKRQQLFAPQLGPPRS